MGGRQDITTLGLSAAERKRRLSDFDSVNHRLRLPSWETVIGWLVAAMLAYAAVDRRVSVLESESRSVQEQLKEIRTDVKELLRRQ